MSQSTGEDSSQKQWYSHKLSEHHMEYLHVSLVPAAAQVKAYLRLNIYDGEFDHE